MADILEENIRDLNQELQWFRRVLDTRFKLYFGQETEHLNIFDIAPPDFEGSLSSWAILLRRYDVIVPERLVLLLALAPHLDPKILDLFFVKNSQIDRSFTEFGGRSDYQHKGFLPTGETALFLLAGSDLGLRLVFKELFHPDHYFSKFNLLYLKNPDSVDLPMSGALTVSKSCLDYITCGIEDQPLFGQNFPAIKISTPLDWTDLVLESQSLSQVREIETWILHRATLLNGLGMKGKVRTGFCSLFYGNPGTGKKMAACLLGKSTGHEVYRIDLSLIVSQYISETEERLAKVFQMAEDKNWILLFDEADALFGKRTDVKSSSDRYANQEVAYLLQRIENFNGIVILSANTAVNEAFADRFESIIHFPDPTAEERLQIWQQGISPNAQLSSSIDLKTVAGSFELTGGAIMEVIRYASLDALKSGTNTINLRSILQGIKRVLKK